MKKFCVLFVLLLFHMVICPPMIIAFEYDRGDVSRDGNTNIADVAVLIDYLLSGVWPEEYEVETDTITVNGVSFVMVRVIGGMFTMGATSEQGSNAQNNEKPAHKVLLSTFSIGQTEVTQALWKAVMGTNPSNNIGDNLPVEHIRRSECISFIKKLNSLTGLNFRLPTEAEWEFAARGGKLSKGYIYSGSNDVDDVAWYKDNAGGTTHEVGTKAPNELGLYDMSGNVSEWCQDWYGNYSASAQTNPTGPSSGTKRVHRGGHSYYNNNWLLKRTTRVFDRDEDLPNEKHNIHIGLRLAL